jgi:hypothetical protein
MLRGVAHEVPPFPAAAIEAICRELVEPVTGAQIANLLVPLKVREAPGEQSNTKWKRLFNAVVARQNHQRDGRPLVRLITEVMQPVRFSTPEEHETHRTAVNARLFLYGYEVRDDGNVRRVPKAQTVSEARTPILALPDVRAIALTTVAPSDHEASDDPRSART